MQLSRRAGIGWNEATGGPIDSRKRDRIDDGPLRHATAPGRMKNM